MSVNNIRSITDETTPLWKEPNPDPDPASDWECLVHTNPGCWYDEAEKKVIMFYRAAGDDEWYETEGFYPGVCFPSGKVILGVTLYVYYGGADKYLGLATCKLEELLDYLHSCPC